MAAVSRHRLCLFIPSVVAMPSIAYCVVCVLCAANGNAPQRALCLSMSIRTLRAAQPVHVTSLFFLLFEDFHYMRQPVFP